MEQGLKTKWVAALRSGEYQQGCGILCRRDPKGNYYCCLGVLAKVAGMDFNVTGSEVLGDLNYSKIHELLQDVAPQKITGKLIRMNDGHGLPSEIPATFSKIADYVEKNL